MNEQEIERLLRQGCYCDDWNLMSISEYTDLSKIRNVYFRGHVSIGANAEIINVPGGLCNIRIGNNVRIINAARIEATPDARFGIGTEVAVLDETGGRSVRIYPGISAQTATIAVRLPEYSRTTLLPMIDRHISEMPDMPEIGDGVEIIDCGPISDVRIWPGSKVEGASWLRNGSIVDNAGNPDFPTYVGQGVNAENFIIEDAWVANGVLLRNTYVGQGCVLDKGFSSHDSLFFANCTMENGEACSVLAGPYTVSAHKSSLLIGCHTSFMNAGSGTNMSNHMYKLGPLHWGVLERGVKTSSNAYLMHGSRIGAYSLVMGEHKKHPDTSEFPFSYLFGDAKGNTIVVPGAMLRSYGLKRDGEKWPLRDRRAKRGCRQNDRILFRIMTPYTAEKVLKSIEVIDTILTLPVGADGFVTYNGMKLTPSAIEKGRHLYELALHKYIRLLEADTSQLKEPDEDFSKEHWIDLAGMPLTETDLKNALKSESIIELENSLDKAASEMADKELVWLKSRMNGRINMNESAAKAAELDSIIERDRLESLEQVNKENSITL